MKKEAIRKCEDALDVVFLCTYIFVVVYSMLKIASFPVDWPGSLSKVEEYIMSFWLIYASYKLYINFTYDMRDTVLAIFLFVGAIVSARMELNNYLYIVAPMVIAYRMKFDKIAKAYAVTVCSTLLVIYMLSSVRIISSYTYNQFGKTDKLMHLLGFGNSNTFMGYWLFAVMAIFYLLRDRGKWFVWIICVLSITGVLYHQTHSRTTTALIALFCCLFGVWKLVDFLKWVKVKEFFWKVLSPLMIPTPFYVLILTVIFVLFYNLFQYEKGINSFLARALLADTALESLGLQLPNTLIDPSEMVDIPFNWIVGTGAYEYGRSDMLYANLFVLDGLIVLIPYLLFQVLFLYKAYKQRDFMAFIILFAINVLSLMESWMLLASSSVFFLMYFADWRPKYDED